MVVLVTGGAGYIGSHTCVELLEDGYEVIVVDDLSNSSKEVINRIELITGKCIGFFQCSILDETSLSRIFEENCIDAVIHFAGFKSIAESISNPLVYYHNNVTGTLMLCRVMKKHLVKQIVFSSSATVYGNPGTLPVTEDFPLYPSNPYGRSKVMIENILADLHDSDGMWKVSLLRYFNPIGAHSSGLIGEDPKGAPNNLMPYITQVASGRRKKLMVFGDDYDTVDGTGVRDYIHVVDLARAHVMAITNRSRRPGVDILNLGTGRGHSVLEVVRCFERMTGKSIPYEVVSRRSGDIAECYANARRAERELGWRAKRDIIDMCRDAWRFEKGFEE